MLFLRILRLAFNNNNITTATTTTTTTTTCSSVYENGFMFSDTYREKIEVKDVIIFESKCFTTQTDK